MPCVVPFLIKAHRVRIMFGQKRVHLASIVLIFLISGRFALGRNSSTTTSPLPVTVLPKPDDQSNCSFQKRDLFVYSNDSLITINCPWNHHAVNMSQGWVFGLLTYDANRTCKIKSERVLTIISSTMEKNCPSWNPNFQEWCINYLKNATVVTDAASITTSVQFPVQSLLEYNIKYNDTANSPIMLYWIPHFIGQHHKTDECIIQVHTLGGNSRPPMSSSPDSENKTKGGNSSAITSPLPVTVSPKPDDQSKKRTLLIVIIIVVVVLFLVFIIGLVVYCCYRKKACHRRNGNQGNGSERLEMNGHAGEQNF